MLNPPRNRRAGLSLVEVLIVMVILTVTLGEVTRSLINVSRLEPVQRESSAALEAARGVLEVMRTQTFAELAVQYDGEPANDPGGAGTGPGLGFAVEGLSAPDGDADGLPGLIELPWLGGALREDFDDVELGLPRDLNGDGAIDAGDHVGDYTVLPIRIRVEWTGAGGERSIELVSTITPSS